MKILQIFNDNKNKHINRYINELERGIKNINNIEISTYILSNENSDDIYPIFDFSLKNIENINNNFDYIFIHSLPKTNHNIYNVLLNKISVKKILFCHYYTEKEIYNNFNINFLKELINSCYKICIYKNEQVYNTFLKYNITDDKIIKIGLIYNYPINKDIHKENQISMISSSTNNINFDLYIQMFNILKENYISSDYIFKLYGIDKTIQTLGIPNLFTDKFGNPSKYTNINTNIIDSNKINVYPSISFEDYNKIIEKSKFIVNFDNINGFNYTLLDMFSKNTILVINEKIAKLIYINDKQTLYDLKCAIYVNSDDFYNTILNFNKYIKSNNSYLSMCQKTNKLLYKIFDTNKYIENLIRNIQ